MNQDQIVAWVLCPVPRWEHKETKGLVVGQQLSIAFENVDVFTVMVTFLCLDLSDIRASQQKRPDSRGDWHDPHYGIYTLYFTLFTALKFKRKKKKVKNIEPTFQH